MSLSILLAVAAAAILTCRPTAGGAQPMHTTVPQDSAGSVRVQQGHVAEVRFVCAREHEDPFNQVTLDIIVTDPEGCELRVPGFWAAEDRWAVRYSSSKTGMHTYRTECSDPQDTGLHGVTGSIQVVPYSGDSPLYHHGPLRLSPDRRHLQHNDGTPFFWLGDTWWMALCHRLRWPEEFETLTADRVEKGFTVIQIVAGLYPDMPAFDERGANEAGFPWEPDYARIRPEYFDLADRRIQHLADRGLTPCIVGAWGYFLPWMGVDKAKQHWRYLIARYGALPVVWCIAGEANLPYYLTEGFPFDDREQVTGWTQVARYVRQIDPFHRLMSTHPTGLGRLSARGAIDDPSLIDFDMLQTGHGGREVLAPSIDTLRWSLTQSPAMPVLNSEVAYEALLDSIPAEVQRLVFWASMLSGAAGQTYGANGIWQVNRKGQPHGQSPHGGNYGTLPWDEAMHLPGSTQLSLGKRLLERYNWQTFEAHPEWASFDTEAPISLDGCSWIWFPEGNPAADAPTGKRLFRKSFHLPKGAELAGAVLRVSADDAFTAYLNGREVGGGADWPAGETFSDVGSLLHEGHNVLGVAAENRPAPVPANPAGLIACLKADLEDGQSLRVISDGEWRCCKEEAEGWAEPEFDDSAWEGAMTIALHGDAPWGPLKARNEFETPYAAGIPGQVRVIYLPRQEAAIVHHIEPSAVYRATLFDPVDGSETDLGAVSGDADGMCTLTPPSADHSDWVLVLQRGGPEA